MLDEHKKLIARVYWSRSGEVYLLDSAGRVLTALSPEQLDRIVDSIKSGSAIHAAVDNELDGESNQRIAAYRSHHCAKL